ncbi:hypothetical protein lerEdw1_015602 [Lerista edwardsae]|nr:hypothetical protein lerEdw1_015602 [Lerista edwardsae]
MCKGSVEVAGAQSGKLETGDSAQRPVEEEFNREASCATLVHTKPLWILSAVNPTGQLLSRNAKWLNVLSTIGKQRSGKKMICMMVNLFSSRGKHQCSKTCGEGSRYRQVTCMNQDRQDADSLHCELNKRPPDVESCNLPPCEYIWITGDWSECSVTCGKGYKQRLVSCSEIYTGKDHYEYGYQNTVNCPGTQPPNLHSCYLGDCPVLASWRVGNWGSCSVTCGTGIMHRSVQCLTNDDQASTLCRDDLKPEERRTCQNSHDCELPTTCKEVKRLKAITEDGEYYLKIRGRLLKIYCAGMESDRPKEYVTLANGDAENFSEVYSYRLHNPTECPYNGSRREDCPCRKDYTAAGFSAFSKVRLDLNTMQIITTDLQFAQTLDGRPVPFATAGDCYSAAKCPQGRFSINLSGTGLSVAQTSKWLSQGNYAVSEIVKSPDGTKVIGKCGGYCGKCTPSSGTGLDVQVL